MANWIVENRITGEVAYAYTADVATDFPEYPFAQYNHILKKPEAVPVPGRRITKLDFVERLGDPAFSKLLELSLTSVEILKFVKLIDWTTPEADGTSIDLDDPRVQKVRGLEPLLLSLNVEGVAPGWAAEVLA